MNGKRILIIEDDGYQSADLKARLERAGLGIADVECIYTELAFQDLIKRSGELPYDAAVVDMMLRWTDPAPNMTMPPPEILNEGFYIAGLRCCRMLKKWKVPCVIFTALDPLKIPLLPDEDLKIINKSLGHEPLFEALRQFLAAT
jgi:hypothetical protein